MAGKKKKKIKKVTCRQHGKRQQGRCTKSLSRSIRSTKVAAVEKLSDDEVADEPSSLMRQRQKAGRDKSLRTIQSSEAAALDEVSDDKVSDEPSTLARQKQKGGRDESMNRTIRSSEVVTSDEQADNSSHRKLAHAEASRLRRSCLTEDQIRKNREQSKLRMRRMRARKKEAEKHRTLTRHEKQDLREKKKLQRKYWRESKRKYRKQQKLKEAECMQLELDGTSHDEQNTLVPRNIIRGAKFRLKKVLPHKPEVFAVVMKELLSEASPEKKKQLDKVCVSTPSTSARRHACEVVVNRLALEERLLRKKRDAQSLAKRRLILDFVSNKEVSYEEFLEDCAKNTKIEHNDTDTIEIEGVTSLPIEPSPDSNITAFEHLEQVPKNELDIDLIEEILSMDMEAEVAKLQNEDVTEECTIMEEVDTSHTIETEVSNADTEMTEECSAKEEKDSSHTVETGVSKTEEEMTEECVAKEEKDPTVQTEIHKAEEGLTKECSAMEEKGISHTLQTGISKAVEEKNHKCPPKEDTDIGRTAGQEEIETNHMVETEISKAIKEITDECPVKEEKDTSLAVETEILKAEEGITKKSLAKEEKDISHTVQTGISKAEVEITEEYSAKEEKDSSHTVETEISKVEGKMTEECIPKEEMDANTSIDIEISKAEEEMTKKCSCTGETKIFKAEEEMTEECILKEEMDIGASIDIKIPKAEEGMIEEYRAEEEMDSSHNVETEVCKADKEMTEECPAKEEKDSSHTVQSEILKPEEGMTEECSAKEEIDISRTVETEVSNADEEMTEECPTKEEKDSSHTVQTEIPKAEEGMTEECPAKEEMDILKTVETEVSKADVEMTEECPAKEEMDISHTVETEVSKADKEMTEECPTKEKKDSSHTVQTEILKPEEGMTEECSAKEEKDSSHTIQTKILKPEEGMTEEYPAKEEMDILQTVETEVSKADVETTAECPAKEEMDTSHTVGTEISKFEEEMSEECHTVETEKPKAEEGMTEECSAKEEKDTSHTVGTAISEAAEEMIQDCPPKEETGTSCTKVAVRRRSVFGMRSSYFKEKACHKIGRSGISEKVKEKVKEFFDRSDNSINLPLKRKIYKNGHQRSILRSSLERLHQKFQQESGIKISLTKFKFLRPNHVNLKRTTPIIQCVCIIDENINLKLNALKTVCKLDILKDHLSWTSSSMCEKVQINGRFFHNIQCVKRQCQKCGMHIPRQQLENVLAEKLEQNISFFVWEKQEMPKSKITRIVKERKTCTVAALVDMIVEDSYGLAQHLHNAFWAQMVYDYNRKHPLPGEIVCLSDPSENRRNEHQCQPSSVHWSYTQCSVCPVILNYLCPKQDCNEVVKEVFICLSNDLKHDPHFVTECENQAIAQVENNLGVMFKRIIKHSDGAPTAYKSRYNCYLTSLDQRIERHFFGSHHGKNLADGEGAVAKKELDDAVRTGELLMNSAEDGYAYLKELWKMTSDIHSTHKSKQVLLTEVNRKSMPHVAAVKGIQKVHYMKSIQPGVIKTRELSCVCEGCHSGNSSCTMTRSVGTCFEHVLTRQTSRRAVPVDLEMETEIHPPLDGGAQSVKQPVVDLGKESAKKRTTESTDKEQSSIKRNKRGNTPNDHDDEAGPMRKPMSGHEEVGSEKECAANCMDNSLNTSDNEHLTPGSEKECEANCIDNSPSDSEHLTRGPFEQNKPEILGVNTPKYAEGQELIGQETSRKTFIMEIQQKLSSISDYNTFLQECQQFALHFADIPLPRPNLENISLAPIHITSCNWYPAGAPAGMLPRVSRADGNCLFNSVAQLLWGTQKWWQSTELRVRVCIELILHEDFYLDNVAMNVGLPQEKNITQFYIQTLEHYRGEKLTNCAMKKLFRKEVMTTACNAEYASMFHVHGLSNVCHTNIQTVYPDLGGPFLRRMMNRICCPRSETSDYFAIMWTRLSGGPPAKVNHFVPLGKAIR